MACFPIVGAICTMIGWATVRIVSIARRHAHGTCAVTGLGNGTACTFTVTATNAVGTGPASGVARPVTPFLPPVLGHAVTGVA